MSGINQLSEATAASGSMQLPVYDTGNGQPRKLSLTALLAWVQSALTSDTSGPFKLAQLTVAEIAASYPASANTGAIVFCSNGASGAACLAVSDGTTWLRVALGAAIAAS